MILIIGILLLSMLYGLFKIVFDKDSDFYNDSYLNYFDYFDDYYDDCDEFDNASNEI